MTHTPGPWKARRANAYESLTPLKCYTIDGTGWDSFALIAVDMEFQSDTAEGLANVRLIAAAPEMLEALKMARGWLDAWGSAGPYLDVIDAAIAKATGTDK